MSDPGYAIQPGIFSRVEIGRLKTALAGEVLTRSRAGARHMLSTRPIAALANDERLLEIASHWLGGRGIPFKATLFEKSSAANWLVAWHQDTALPLTTIGAAPGWGPWSEKQGVIYARAPARALEKVVALRVHLDDSDRSNGPLRVLPCTHLDGVLTDAQVHERAQSIEAVSCHVYAGGVVALRPLIIHASSKASDEKPRSVVHIEYATSLEVEPGMHLHIA